MVTEALPCKAHDGAHRYTVCPECEHQYCPISWDRCPRSGWHAAHAEAPAVPHYSGELRLTLEQPSPAPVGFASERARVAWLASLPPIRTVGDLLLHLQQFDPTLAVLRDTEEFGASGIESCRLIQNDCGDGRGEFVFIGPAEGEEDE